MAHPSGGRTPPDHRKLRAKIVRGWLRADALVAPAGVANGKTKPAAFGGAKPLTLKKGHLGDFPRCRQGSERPGERPSSYLMQPPRCKGSSAPETPCRCLGGDSPPHSKLKYRVPGSSAIFFIPSEPDECQYFRWTFSASVVCHVCVEAYRCSLRSR